MYKSQIASLMLKLVRRKAGQIGQLRPVISNDICNVQISGITLMMIQRPAKCLKKVILSVQKCLEGANVECILKRGNKGKDEPFSFNQDRRFSRQSSSLQLHSPSRRRPRLKNIIITLLMCQML